MQKEDNNSVVGVNNLLLNPALLKQLVQKTVKQEIKNTSVSYNPLSYMSKEIFWGATLGLGTFVGFMVSLRFLGFLTKHDLKQWYESFSSDNAKAVEQENQEFDKNAKNVKTHLQNAQQQTDAIENRRKIFDQNQDQIQQDHLNKLSLKKLELDHVVDTCNSLLQINFSEFFNLMKGCKNLSGIAQLGNNFAKLLQKSNIDFENVQNKLSEQNTQFTKEISQFSEQQKTAYQNQTEYLQTIGEILLNFNKKFDQSDNQLEQLHKRFQELQKNQQLDDQKKVQLKNEIAQQLSFFITSFDAQENQLELLENQLQNVNQVHQDTKVQMCQMFFLLKGGKQEDWPNFLQELIHQVGPSRPLPDFLQIKEKKEQERQGMQNFIQIQNLVKFGYQFNDQMNQSNYLALTYN